jgi:hypothetical protein
LRLLLLLSALIAGMTGLIAGPVAARQPAAIAAVLSGQAEQVAAKAEVRLLPEEGTVRPASTALLWVRVHALSPQFHPVNERRNE